VVVTHDPEVAARCTRTIAVRDGRIISSAVAA
jgi:putative ABC transport system ATP-binding protein